VGYIHVFRFGCLHLLVTGRSVKDILQLVEGVNRATISNGWWQAEWNPQSHILVSQAILIVWHIQVFRGGWHTLDRLITVRSIKDILQLVERVHGATIGNSWRHAERNPFSHVFMPQAVFIVGNVKVFWRGWHSIDILITFGSIKCQGSIAEHVEGVHGASIGYCGWQAVRNPCSHIFGWEAVLVIWHKHVGWFWHTIFNILHWLITGRPIKDILQFVERVHRATIGNSWWHAERDPFSHVFLSQAFFIVGNVEIFWGRRHTLDLLVAFGAIKCQRSVAEHVEGVHGASIGYRGWQAVRNPCSHIFGREAVLVIWHKHVRWFWHTIFDILHWQRKCSSYDTQNNQSVQTHF